MYPPTITGLPFPDLDFLLVEGGKFQMGDETGDLWEACRPVHPVAVSSFYMAIYPVTQRLYRAVMDGANPSRFKGDLRPVETVSWLDAQAFIEKLNTALSFPKGTRLPTEAEWEYAARGGIHAQGYAYAGSDKLRQVGWYDENANDETHDVGLLLANELGIHDLSGNVYEWCEDEWHESYKGGPADSAAWVDAFGGGHRVIRGGSYFNSADGCLLAYYSGLKPDDCLDILGFRLALSPRPAREQRGPRPSPEGNVINLRFSKVEYTT